MTEKDVAYDLSNFFLNKSKVKFYLGLRDLKDRKVKFYSLCKKSRISLHHGKIILAGFRDKKLITFEYDQDFFSYVVTYTMNGRKLRDKFLELTAIFERFGIW